MEMGYGKAGIRNDLDLKVAAGPIVQTATGRAT